MSKAERPRIFDYGKIEHEGFTKISYILFESYGRDPAEIAAEIYADKNLRSALREIMNQQSQNLAFRATHYGDIPRHTETIRNEKGHYDFAASYARDFAASSLGPELQKRLDAEGITLKPFYTNRRANMKLSNEEFYEQAVRYVYAIAEYHTLYEKRQEAASYFQTLKVYNQVFPEETALQPAQSDYQCEFPPGYLEALWVTQRS